MIAKRENNTLTLPDDVLSEFGGVEYFDVLTTDDGGILLKPSALKPKKKNGVASLCGLGKGKVWMADDFNDTPEDFAEYM